MPGLWQFLDIFFSSLPNNKISDWSKFKVFADDIINVTQKLKFILERAENIVGKGENAGHQHFLLFQQCFLKAFFTGSLKVGLCGKELNRQAENLSFSFDRWIFRAESHVEQPSFTTHDACTGENKQSNSWTWRSNAGTYIHRVCW